MKNIILLAVTFGLYVTNAQEFKATEKYILTNERTIGQEEEGAAQIDLVLAENEFNTIATLEITEVELLESVQVSVLENPYLEGITEILKVEFEYAACCSSTNAYYYLVTEDSDFIALPSIENLYCGYFDTDVHYVFPSQAHGQEGTILRAQLHYTDTYTIKDIEVVQSFVWNDDDFDTEEAISAIN